MEQKEELYFVYYKCVSCFFNWNGISDKEEQNVIIKKCDFCEKNPSSLNLLKRQVDILECANQSDFPKVLKNLLDHIVLKEN